MVSVRFVRNGTDAKPSVSYRVQKTVCDEKGFIMKLWKKVAAVLFIVAMLLSTSVWAQAKDNNTPLNFTGSVWVSKVGSLITLTFTSETDGEYTYFSGKGVFSCKADRITLIGTGFTGSYNYMISGNTLIIKRLYLNTDILFTKSKDGDAVLILKETVWKSNFGPTMTLSFTSEKSGVYSDFSGSGTFSCAADTISFVGTGFTGSYDYTISENTLTIKRLYLDIDISFIKQ